MALVMIALGQLVAFLLVCQFLRILRKAARMVAVNCDLVELQADRSPRRHAFDW